MADNPFTPLPVNSEDPEGYGCVTAANPSIVTGASTTAANRMNFNRVVSGGAVTAVRVGVAVAAGNIAVAFYANNGQTGVNAAPGAYLGGTGSVATVATAGGTVIPLTAPIRVRKGDWVAVGSDSATTSLVQFSASGQANAPVAGFSGYADTAFPPATTTAPALTSQAYRSYLVLGV